MWNLWTYQVFWSKTKQNVLLIHIEYCFTCIVICIVLLINYLVSFPFLSQTSSYTKSHHSIQHVWQHVLSNDHLLSTWQKKSKPIYDLRTYTFDICGVVEKVPKNKSTHPFKKTNKKNPTPLTDMKWVILINCIE